MLALGTGPSTNILARITRYSFDTLGLKDELDVFAQLNHVSLVWPLKCRRKPWRRPRQQEIPDTQGPRLKISQ